MDDSLNNMLKKLRDRGDLSEKRISELEASVKHRVETSMASELENRLNVLEKVFDTSIKEEVKKGSSTWIIPFVILIVVIGGSVMVVYNKYKYLQKEHLL